MIFLKRSKISKLGNFGFSILRFLGQTPKFPILLSDISSANNSKSKCCYNARPWAYYFYVKADMSVDFQICINVPLRQPLCSCFRVI